MGSSGITHCYSVFCHDLSRLRLCPCFLFAHGAHEAAQAAVQNFYVQSKVWVLMHAQQQFAATWRNSIALYDALCVGGGCLLAQYVACCVNGGCLEVKPSRQMHGRQGDLECKGILQCAVTVTRRRMKHSSM